MEGKSLIFRRKNKKGEGSFPLLGVKIDGF
jgi:hypothetical protein